MVVVVVVVVVLHAAVCHCGSSRVAFCGNSRSRSSVMSAVHC